MQYLSTLCCCFTQGHVLIPDIFPSFAKTWGMILTLFQDLIWLLTPFLGRKSYIKQTKKSSPQGLFLSAQILPDLSSSQDTIWLTWRQNWGVQWEETVQTIPRPAWLHCMRFFFLFPSLSGLQGFFWCPFSECTLDRTQSVLCVHRVDYIKCDKDLVPALLGQHSWQKPKDSVL